MIELKENKNHATKDLGKLRAMLREEDSKRKRETIQFKDWQMTEDGFKIKKKVYPMRDSGMKTLLRLFHMPVKFYYETSPTDMLVRDINRIRDEYTEDSEMSVFFSGGEVRAITRPDIGVIDNHNSILESLNIGEKLFHKASFNDYGLRVMTTDSDKPIKVEKGDIINAGMELMYSDIGNHPTTGYPFFNRLICTNGLVIQEKSKFISGFKVNHTLKTPTEIFLKTINSNVEKITADTKVLSETFKKMKDITVRALPYGEQHLKRLRSVITPDRFDKHENMVLKVMEEESNKEKIIVNPDAVLYDVVDIATREAKAFHHLERRRIESMSGALVSMVMDMN